MSARKPNVAAGAGGGTGTTYTVQGSDEGSTFRVVIPWLRTDQPAAAMKLNQELGTQAVLVSLSAQTPQIPVSTLAVPTPSMDDVDSATRIAAYMVGFCGMGPEPIVLDGDFENDEEREEAEKEYLDRFDPSFVGVTVTLTVAVALPPLPSPTV